MFQEARDSLAHDLDTGSDGNATPLGVTIHQGWPDRLVTPCAIIGPGVSSRTESNYASAGQFPGTFNVNLMVVLLVPRTATCMESLESLVEIVLENTIDWAMEGVDIPAPTSEGNQESLGTVVRLSKQMKLV